MVSVLKRMQARWAQPGRVDWIGLRPERLAAVVPVDRAEIGTNGLSGDHGRPGKRAVTLLQAEHLAAIGAYLGQGPVAPETLRRNIVVAGLNLSALRGRRVQIGAAVVEITGPCAPCSRMETALGHGGYSALRGHGGWCAAVIDPGPVALNDPVTPTEPLGQDD